ncbi:hypothetical protein ACWA6H_12695 [Pseudomonas bijieensis]|jgi:hypothetical protein|uniref:hypothetical protein n=1 Tax=Pseudomonas TaxID=286 RepID=UPI000D6C3984|nr:MULTISPECIES: hypothetical protein [Pseudomonas]AXP03649.1 hypothetical protein DZG01_11900 [Pseudomonas fluorescens]MCD9116967.1 hypothetical protein [Pseudomonas bijieensis]PWJ38780.1 hypothetical protein ATJ40_104118 [Pseudomonas sp. 43mfcvi1.1]SSB96044.1 hypothetical protein SAMN04488697_104118 [Pseudomonas sp. 43mfcvi1.1]
MTSHETVVGRANEADLDGILALQAANQMARGGSLSARSLHAHLKMGMKEVASFPFNGFDFAVYSYIG